MVKVKICGITNEDDAQAACDAGAHALGFIFTEKSPRFIAPEQARAITEKLPPFVTKVGVFVNAEADLISTTVEQVGLNSVQLHGDEPPDICGALQVPVIKAFRMRTGFRMQDISAYDCSMYLLDTYSTSAYGGTGETFDWQMAIDAKAYGRIMLAGGLNPENIYDAVTTVRPYAVDISSGVEKEPGRKDHSKIKQLFDRLRLFK